MNKKTSEDCLPLVNYLKKWSIDKTNDHWVQIIAYSPHPQQKQKENGNCLRVFISIPT